MLVGEHLRPVIAGRLLTARAMKRSQALAAACDLTAPAVAGFAPAIGHTVALDIP
jgi:hypothetical protein